MHFCQHSGRIQALEVNRGLVHETRGVEGVQENQLMSNLVIKAASMYEILGLA